MDVTNALTQAPVSDTSTAPPPVTPYPPSPVGPVADPQALKAQHAAGELKQAPNPDWPTMRAKLTEDLLGPLDAKADRSELADKADLKDLQALGETVSRHGAAISAIPAKDDTEIKRVRGVVDTILDRMSKSTQAPLDKSECQALRDFLRGN